MTTLAAYRERLSSTFQPIPRYLGRPANLFKSYDRANLRPDLIAGITVAVILLPQAIAFALIAELPPEMGLFAAIVGAIAGALWGSSNQIHTGPTNAISLLVLSALLTATRNPTEFIIAAGLMAVMAGIFQLVMGLARLGVVVNFVSHSVIVGFATGAGILIGVKQLLPLLGLQFENHNILETVIGLFAHVAEIHRPTMALGVGTILLILVLRRINPRLPAALISMVVTAVIVYLLNLHEAGVRVIGQLPATFPPLTDISQFSLDLVARLSTGALAVGAIGLVETAAISRSIATQTGQRLDSNQEFVGQGIANILAGLFSGYAVAGSFSRSAVNHGAGARTPVAAILSSLFVLIAIFTIGPLAAFLPRTALAGVLIVTAVGMVDRAEISRIWRGAQGDAMIMLVTFLGTLFLEIEFAVLLGILLSFAVYIMRTSTPRVHAVLPDDDFRHFLYQPHKPECPQLGIIDILGDLYFGAVNHVEETILAHSEEHPEQRFLLIRMHNVNQCDFSGIHMLENITRVYRDRGGDVYLVRVGYRVLKLMQSTQFDRHLGRDHFLSEDEAVSFFFHKVLDPAVCIYECNVRAFRECQNLPKQVMEGVIPLRQPVRVEEKVPLVDPRTLWQQLHDQAAAPPLVIDVREPREYRRGHITEAQLLPLPDLLREPPELPPGAPVVLVCRSGRRSRRAILALRAAGHDQVVVLDGGMLAWEAAGLLTAVEWQARGELPIAAD